MNLNDSKEITALPWHVAQLRDELQSADPYSLAERTGAAYNSKEQSQGEFRLPFWGQEIAVSYPAYIASDPQTGEELSLDVQAILLFHFRTSNGTPPSGRWISFSELPDGKFYNAAFQGYSGSEMAKAFQDDRAAFERAAEKLGGRWEALGNAAFSFRALPQVHLLAVFWEGDEDFPTSMQVLFDASIVHHIPTGVCATLGAMLARRLIKAGRA